MPLPEFDLQVAAGILHCFQNAFGSPGCRNATFKMPYALCPLLSRTRPAAASALPLHAQTTRVLQSYEREMSSIVLQLVEMEENLVGLGA